MSITNSPCPDCDAEQRVTPCTVGGRPGGTLVQTIHAPTCPTLRGVI